MSSKRKLNEDWYKSGFNVFPCPRCNKQDEATGGMMVLIPSKALHELDNTYPDNGLLMVLCHPCALEIIGNVGIQLLASKISAFVKSHGSRGSEQLP
jgi:hypothetical protein